MMEYNHNIPVSQQSRPAPRIPDSVRAKNTALHQSRLDAAWRPIRDIPYEYNADIGLAYASPVRGVWNIVHIGTLVPGGHQVYVCPTSCLRGVVLTTAEMGRMDKLSTICIGEDNIIEGDMEEMLYRGVTRIIRELTERPRMMMIFTSCIHHFMAVNYKRVYRILQKEYPDIDFIDCYMDPIMRRTNPVVPALWRQMHRVLKPSAHRNRKQVNYIGNCFPHAEYCDLTALLQDSGIRVLEANHCGDYDEFLSMADSACNFVFHTTGVKAAKDMKIRLGQEYLKLRPGYSYAEFDEDLRAAAALAGIPAPSAESLDEQKRRTEADVFRTQELLGDTPLAIDYTAVDGPLEFALYLLNHGFQVESVFVDAITERQEIFDTLRRAKPDLRIYESYGWNIRQMPRGHDGKIVCAGQKAAYFMDSDYFVNEVENEGMYGYRGIRRMMALLRDAAAHPKPMKELVQIKGWGCGCGSASALNTMIPTHPGR